MTLNCRSYITMRAAPYNLVGQNLTKVNHMDDFQIWFLKQIVTNLF